MRVRYRTNCLLLPFKSGIAIAEKNDLEVVNSRLVQTIEDLNSREPTESTDDMEKSRELYARNIQLEDDLRQKTFELESAHEECTILRDDMKAYLKNGVYFGSNNSSIPLFIILSSFAL